MEYLKKIVITLGIIIWVGTISPEIFVKSGKGCIFDENGVELEEEEATEFMEAFFYEDAPIKVNFRFALLDYLGGRK
jgi:hypothetical protein